MLLRNSCIDFVEHMYALLLCYDTSFETFGHLFYKLLLFINIISPQYLSSDKTNWISRLMFFMVSYLKKYNCQKSVLGLPKSTEKHCPKMLKRYLLNVKTVSKMYRISLSRV